ncbi:MAG: G1 family endopeptidase [Candidatus Dormibacteraeota bacterium]|nr:G1 family endopeptidase [Candidatus Dormibacteraeota bacterium]
MLIRTRVGQLAAAACVAASLFAGSPAIAAPGISHGALHFVGAARAGLLQSTNWSGDVVIGKMYKRVTSTWVVPTVRVSKNDRYAATWVGIGGVTSGDLIQAGTAEASVNGRARYFAWTEVLPQPQVPIDEFAVHPGDSMTVDVHNTGGKTWVITVKNNNTGETAVRHFHYTSGHGSAEWIHEAPIVVSAQAQLTSTTKVRFDHGTVNGRTVIGSAGTLLMIQLIGQTDATPSNLDSDSDGLTIADGLIQPPPPWSGGEPD